MWENGTCFQNFWKEDVKTTHSHIKLSLTIHLPRNVTAKPSTLSTVTFYDEETQPWAVTSASSHILISKGKYCLPLLPTRALSVMTPLLGMGKEYFPPSMYNPSKMEARINILVGPGTLAWGGNVRESKKWDGTEDLLLLLKPYKVLLKNLQISILNHGKLHTACWWLGHGKLWSYVMSHLLCWKQM